MPTSINDVLGGNDNLSKVVTSTTINNATLPSSFTTVSATGDVKMIGGKVAIGVDPATVGGTPGDLIVSRISSPTAGAVYFGNTSASTTYLYYDGSAFRFSGGSVAVLGAISATTQITTGAIATGLVTNAAATLTVAATTATVIQTTAASIYTLPAAASFTGRKLHLVTQFAGTVVSDTANVVPLIGGAAATGILAATAGKFAILQSNGTNWVIIGAN